MFAIDVVALAVLLQFAVLENLQNTYSCCELSRQQNYSDEHKTSINCLVLIQQLCFAVVPPESNLLWLHAISQHTLLLLKK